MAISAGLVGLPNVGKSTLFNALTSSSVPAENYPFCTIDPHLACTFVPDNRIKKFKAIYGSEKVIPATVQFVDIAGLVKGAASGEGLGNQFLSHIREVDLVIHVLRCFKDITEPEERDPLVDYEIIVTELMLKDLESVTKRLSKIESLKKASKSDPKALKALEGEKTLLEKISHAIDDADPEKVRHLLTDATVETIPLLCAKNFLIVANISEDELCDSAYKKNLLYQNLIERFGENRVIPVSARLEHELMQLNAEEKEEMRSMMGVTKDYLAQIIKRTYQELNLITFFTCGPKEIHAWPIKKGTPVRQAAGEIHSDLERGFICAEVFNGDDLINLSSESKLKDAGKIRTEGQDYLVQDGDVLHIKFNVQ